MNKCNWTLDMLLQNWHRQSRNYRYICTQKQVSENIAKNSAGKCLMSATWHRTDIIYCAIIHTARILCKVAWEMSDVCPTLRLDTWVNHRWNEDQQSLGVNKWKLKICIRSCANNFSQTTFIDCRVVLGVDSNLP